MIGPAGVPCRSLWRSEAAPRRQITSQGKTWRLYWADMHCHNGLTADAEGEPDEMHFYARDRAKLDVVVFTNNDFYNVPLDAVRLSTRQLVCEDVFSKPRFAPETRSSLCPGFEWTSRIPSVATAKLSDPGNWLPPVPQPVISQSPQCDLSAQRRSPGPLHRGWQRHLPSQ